MDTPRAKPYCPTPQEKTQQYTGQPRHTAATSREPQLLVSKQPSRGYFPLSRQIGKKTISLKEELRAGFIGLCNR
jgi:hypothetical protein